MITFADLDGVILRNYGSIHLLFPLSLCPPGIIPEEETN